MLKGSCNMSLKTKQEQIELDDERTGFALRLLKSGKLKCEIKQGLRKEFGIERDTCEKIISRARSIARAELNGEIDDHRADALMFYKGVVSDENAPMRYRLRARRQLDRILGLEKRESDVGRGGEPEMTNRVDTGLQTGLRVIESLPEDERNILQQAARIIQREREGQLRMTSE
jgi:hypothetical protein